MDDWTSVALPGAGLGDDINRYSTLAGFMLPQVGSAVPAPGLSFEVVAMDGQAIDKVRIRRADGVQAPERLPIR